MKANYYFPGPHEDVLRAMSSNQPSPAPSSITFMRSETGTSGNDGRARSSIFNSLNNEGLCLQAARPGQNSGHNNPLDWHSIHHLEMDSLHHRYTITSMCHLQDTLQEHPQVSLTAHPPSRWMNTYEYHVELSTQVTQNPLFGNTSLFHYCC